MGGFEKVNPKYQRILEVTEPYVLSYPGNFDHFNFNPWEQPIKEENRLSCIDANNEKFFDLLYQLDQVAFGPMGMPMDKWIFFDCGEMPGGVFGFGVRADYLSDDALKEYKIDRSYKGLIPISMYIAIPMIDGKTWFGHNLSSANRILPEKLPGMGLFTKAMALKVFNIESMFGATQWDSKALHIHLQLADMEVVSSYTPAHTYKNSLTYKSKYPDQRLLDALSGPKKVAQDWDFLYPTDDEQFSRDFQKKIHAGEKYQIVGRPFEEKGKIVLPIKRG